MRWAINQFGEDGEEIYHGSDSTVIIPKNTLLVTKDYHSLQEEDIRRYSQLHKILSTEVFVLELSEELQNRFGIGIKCIEISFLDIGEDISSQKGFVQHKIPLVKGDVLSNLGENIIFSDNNPDAFINFIEKEISCFVSKKLGISDRFLGSINMFYIFRENIKIIGIDKNTLSLLVTDIGSSVSRLLLENREAIDRILQSNF